MGSMVPRYSHITRMRGICTHRRRSPRPWLGEEALSFGTDRFRFAEALSMSLDLAVATFFEWFFETHGMTDFDGEATLPTHLRSRLERMRVDPIADSLARQHATAVAVSRSLLHSGASRIPSGMSSGS